MPNCWEILVPPLPIGPAPGAHFFGHPVADADVGEADHEEATEAGRWVAVVHGWPLSPTVSNARIILVRIESPMTFRLTHPHDADFPFLKFEASTLRLVPQSHVHVHRAPPRMVLPACCATVHSPKRRPERLIRFGFFTIDFTSNPTTKFYALGGQ